VEKPFRFVTNDQDNERIRELVAAASYSLEPIGFIRSPLKCRDETPRQGLEGAPDAWLEVSACFVEALQGISVGQEIVIITWLHEARRDTLKVHPRGDESCPLTGVFSTRSPDRPNPLGLHPVTIREIVGSRIRIGPIEAIDGTPVADINPCCRNQQTHERAASCPMTCWAAARVTAFSQRYTRADFGILLLLSKGLFLSLPLTQSRLS
jgi:tRNA-Thr(GGU) m(6)t(6)A37 methyltransferase TsaA